MQYLPSTYDPGVVVGSAAIATFAAYVAFELANRGRFCEASVRKLWWLGGSIAMGTGIWCMHFTGMLAFSLPIRLGYSSIPTLLSWIAGVTAAAIALSAATAPILTRRAMVVSSLSMAAGICTMHYVGMAALDMAPGIDWSYPLVAASIAVAFGACALALTIFSWLRSVSTERRVPYQFLGALFIGAAICGVHYTAMAAARFPSGAVCLSSSALMGNQLGVLVAFGSIILLLIALLSSLLDARMQDKLKLTNTKLQAAYDELQHRALLDPLTELPNRLLFEDRLMHALERKERTDSRLSDYRRETIAVLFIDLDGFKPINDSLGHAAGDEVLKEAARRLQIAARNCDTLARIGGDEFVLLMEDVEDAADCISLARRLVDLLGQPLQIAGRQVTTSASVGIVVCSDNRDKDQLVAQADAAMYSAKRAGGNTYALFEPHMDAGALEQLSLHNDLRNAVKLNQLQLHYQPKIDTVQGSVRGVEALLRWTHPERGSVSPAIFIPLAERFGLINSIGNWVIDEACRQMREWADNGLHVRVAINISVYQLREVDLVERIELALNRNCIDASQLLCEITESVAMEDIKDTQRAFNDLARIGVFLSIDDFGTGYSSLSYLRKLPARQIKIDRSFVSDIALSADARAIVSAVIRLAHELGLRVVAEGVETLGQRDILYELGCDELQGFFLARPMSAEMLSSFADERRHMRAGDFAPTVMDQQASPEASTVDE